MPHTVPKIDILSIGVEVADELVLLSNDWEKYKPKVICIERHMNYSEFLETSLNKILTNLSYSFAAKSGQYFFFFLN
jgi:hypothetical protein